MNLDEAVSLKDELTAWNENQDQLDEIRIVTYDGSMFWVEAFETDEWLVHQHVFASRDAFDNIVGAGWQSAQELNGG
ncbi:MAG: hypothetical protein ACR2JC_11335 [Chloroflexota bacterium]|nr:MAG: hypothetical protein DLM70_01465 [Chloroflexota bacterium]